MISYSPDRVIGGYPLHHPDERAALAAVRTYYEQHQLREVLHAYVDEKHANIAVEFGCGFGRMLPVLAEFCTEVVGYERDLDLAQLAKRLLLRDGIDIANQAPQTIDALGFYPDVVLTYTCLQHMTNVDAKQVCDLIRKSIRQESVVVLVEDTSDQEHMGVFPCRGRAPTWYASALGMRLLHQAGRQTGNTADGPVGEVMVFKL